MVWYSMHQTNNYSSSWLFIPILCKAVVAEMQGVVEREESAVIQSISKAYRGLIVQESNLEASSERLSGAFRKAGTTSTGTDTLPVEQEPIFNTTAGAEYLQNVDIGKEMVNIDLARRAYEANAKVVEVSNEMLKKTIGLDV